MKYFVKNKHAVTLINFVTFSCVMYKGSFTYYVIKGGGEGGFQMITLDYEGGGGFWPMIT